MNEENLKLPETHEYKWSHVLIPWSGGLDSTYLIYKYLSLKHTVRTLEVESDQFPGSVFSRKTRNKIHKILEKEFNTKIIRKIVKTGNDIGTRGRGLFQQPWFVSTGHAHLDDDEDLIIGYVKGDGALTCLDKLLNVFNSLNSLNVKKSKIVFPIVEMDKSDIMININPKYIKLIEYCENISKKSKSCGNCPSCIAHKKAELYFDYYKSKSRDVEDISKPKSKALKRKKS